MNWEAIGAVGEIVGAITVLVTLGYLAVQVRHAREEIARSARQARTDGLREYWLVQASEPTLASALTKFDQGLGVSQHGFLKLATDAGLTDVEARQILAMFWALWVNTDETFSSLDQMSPGTRAQAENAARVNFSGRARHWYEFFKPTLNPETVRRIDALIARAA